MTFNYDYFGLTEPARIYLCKTDNTIICELNGIDLPTVSYTRQLNNFDTIQFDVHKYINGEESNGYLLQYRSQFRLLMMEFIKSRVNLLLAVIALPFTLLPMKCSF